MCLAAWADYDDDTIRVIWRVERLRQQRDKRQRQLAEIQRMAAETRRILSSLPATVEASPSLPRAEAVAGIPSSQGVAA
ncbi:MAG: hypothetical protein ACTHMK_13860 [Dyella sp.]|uniref:hypothetical protein n=1 Tax=Dyella sp. TaxID=1869338 RepID=UPI003F810ED5